MLKFIIKRALMVIGVLWMVATLTYFTVHVTPGDTATAVLYQLYGEESVNPDNLAKVREHYNLNDPVLNQYLRWIGNAFKGNFGESYRYKKPVSYMIALRLPNTLKLGITAFLFSAALAIPLGIVSALKHSKWQDHISRIFVLIASSFPSFWIAIVLIIVLALKMKLFPVSGMNGVRSIVLPALTLSVGMIATTTRMMRTSMLDVMEQDYIWVAKAKGLTRKKIIQRHVLRNAMPPVVTVLGLQIGHILGGAVVIENIFSWPGVGGLFLDAVNSKDLPMIEGCVLVIAFGYAVINLAVDIIYAWMNPEVRYTGEGS